MKHLLTGLALLLCATPRLAAQAAPQGWAFTWTITSTLRGQPAPATALAFDVVVYQRTARITLRPGANAMRAMLGEGSVILARDGDSVLTVLNPVKREALVATLGEFATFGAGAGAVQLTVSDVSSTVRPQGAAPALDGLAARRVTLVQRYAMSAQMQQMQRMVRVSEETTLDLSVALESRGGGFRAFAQQVLRALGKPGAVQVALRASEARLPRGAPLRTSTVTLTMAGTDTVRAESVGIMSGLQRVPVDTTTMRVPEGYRVTEARRLLQPKGRP